jgi:glyoxylase-like metal-dependent hydrolase (beta-lactamase superfamily II)
MPYITGRSKYPPPDPTVGGGGMSWFSFLYPRGPTDIRSKATVLPADGSVPGLAGWKWIHTPGHTAGHVSFFRDDDRVLLAGDAFVTTRSASAVSVASERQELHGPPTYYTSDWEAAGQSVERLAGLQASVLATGHGVPMYGLEAAQRLEEMAASFFYTEVPQGGRYVGHPALTNERGIIWVPPARTGPLPQVVATVALAGVAWYAYRRLRRND